MYLVGCAVSFVATLVLMKRFQPDGCPPQRPFYSLYRYIFKNKRGRKSCGLIIVFFILLDKQKPQEPGGIRFPVIPVLHGYRRLPPSRRHGTRKDETGPRPRAVPRVPTVYIRAVRPHHDGH